MLMGRLYDSGSMRLHRPGKGAPGETGRPVSADERQLHDRLQILVRDRLTNIPILVQHLNVAAAIARALLSVIEGVLACVLAAPDRANAFGFENFPAALFLPTRIS